MGHGLAPAVVVALKDGQTMLSMLLRFAASKPARLLSSKRIKAFSRLSGRALASARLSRRASWAGIGLRRMEKKRCAASASASTVPIAASSCRLLQASRAAVSKDCNVDFAPKELQVIEVRGGNLRTRV
jgi:hypothetical protein